MASLECTQDPTSAKVKEEGLNPEPVHARQVIYYSAMSQAPIFTTDGSINLYFPVMELNQGCCSELRPQDFYFETEFL